MGAFPHGSSIQSSTGQSGITNVQTSGYHERHDIHKKGRIMLKIWGRRNSINVQKVMWVVQELGLSHERIDAGMQYGVVDEPWYRAMNPNGRVPTIDDEGFVLWESNAIVRYLVRRYGEGRLVPYDGQAWAVADSWMDWASSVMGPPVTALFWGLIRTPAEQRDAKALEPQRQQLEQIATLLDAHLARNPFVAGDAVSFGDVPVGCFVHRWQALPIEHGHHPHIADWYGRLRERAAYRDQVMLPLS